jgi:hypothetical protein
MQSSLSRYCIVSSHPCMLCPPPCSFDELARLCDPSGKNLRSDRVSVVADAVRVISNLRVENNQLRQLNKFLEERVGMHERARAQEMMQHAMAQARLQPSGQEQQQQQQQLQQIMVHPDTAAMTTAAGSGLALVHAPSLTVPMGYPLKQEQMPMAQGAAAAMGLTQLILPANAPSISWLPAPDISQDQKLRPPAA